MVIGVVEFEYQPWNKIIVHEIVKYPLEHFLATHSLGIQDGGVGVPLNWADGLIFEYVGMPSTEDVVNEQIQGRIHWIGLSYGIMEEYEKAIIRPGRITVPIIDLSSNAFIHAMAKWIKENFENGEVNLLVCSLCAEDLKAG